MERSEFRLKIRQGLIQVANFCSRNPWKVVVLFAASAAFGLQIVFSNLKISTNTEAMLSPELEWRIANSEFKKHFPFFSDTILIVVDARTPEDARDTAKILAKTLKLQPELFHDVFFAEGHPFIEQNRLLFASIEDLNILTSKLAAAQFFLGTLSQDPSLAALLRLILEINENKEVGPTQDLMQFFDSFSATFEQFNTGNVVPMSWQNLITRDHEPNYRQLIVAYPVLDFQTFAPAERAIAFLAKLTESENIQRPGLSIRLTGSAALAHDELLSVTEGATQAALLALILISISLFWGLRSVSLFLATIVTLVIGLILTATFAAVAVGTLNMISVAFAVLYVGLGVDFAIHHTLRYRELVGANKKQLALMHATSHIGPSILICAASTAFAFFAFIPTSYRGVAELGLISGCGMLIGAFTTFTILPALLTLLPAPVCAKNQIDGPKSNFLIRLTRRDTILLISVIAGGALVAIPRISFDTNPIHLNDPNAQSVTTLLELTKESDSGFHNISYLAPDKKTANILAIEMEKLPEIREVLHIENLIPKHQDEKLLLIDDLFWTLGGELQSNDPSPFDEKLILTKLDMLEKNLSKNSESTDRELATSKEKLRNRIKDLLRIVAQSEEKERRELLLSLDRKFMSHFPSQISAIQQSLKAQRFDADGIPDEIKNRWLSESGLYRLEIVPQAPILDNESAQNFVKAVRSIAGQTVTGVPVVNLEASEAVVRSFAQALISAIALIACLLVILTGRISDAILILIPLLASVLITGTIAVLLDLKINFANIIALPLLFGIGIDSALHLMHRHRERGEDNVPLLRSSTSRAIFFSALTSSASFGSLALSPHAGTASMGQLLTIGLVVTILVTLVLMPALLEHFLKTEEQ